MRRLCASAALLLAVLGSGASCSDLASDPGEIRVQAPAGKCWSGAIGDSTKDGCGSKSFKITGEAIIVGNAQKQTAGHWKLVLRLYVKGDLKDTSSTTATYGIAEVSE